MEPETKTQGMANEARPTEEAAGVLAAARGELARLPEMLAMLLGSLDETTWRARPAPGRWSPLEIVCHLRDEEAEDFGARLRAVLEGGTQFTPIDPEGWVEARRYRDQDPRQALTSFDARRAETLRLLAQVDPARLERSIALGSEGRPRLRLSGLDLLAAWVAHDLLHLRQLAGTLARLWAARVSPLQAQYAGPLPYPPGETKS